MLPQASYIGNPVLSLQTMLRTISFQHEFIPRLIPDGVFGERTLEAAMLFQREFFPPVTGRVDNDTWDAIVEVYQQALTSLAQPRLCTGFPSRDYTISPGQTCVHVGIIQSMFLALSQILEDVECCEVTGVHDGPSVRNTRWVQGLNLAQQTGIIDRDVWDTLSRLYTIFVTFAQSPWLTRQQVLTPTAI